ncbi:MAG: flagellar basal body P-ring formation chaperone FlgA [Pseudomonadota bacterium]
MTRVGLISAIAVLALAADAVAGSVVSTRMLTRGTVIAPSDIEVSETEFGGALRDLNAAIGMETRRTIYAGRPLIAADLTAPAEVRRNENVELRFLRGPLRITTEGRALDRGARGERVSVMNLNSRAIVYGRIVAPGVVEVGQ